MAMSRRKQLHPKSLKCKEDDEIEFVLPNELKYDEKSNEIITRINLKQNHCFGPFPAIFQIEDRIESFQLLDIKYNWLSYCSILNKSSENLNIIFENNQLFIISKKSIPIGTSIFFNKIILPKLNMNKKLQTKIEPIENQINKSYTLLFICEKCGIQFSNRNTLNAHRQYYCPKQETTNAKRKSTDDSLSTIPVKRLLNDKCCSDCDIIFNHPIQIGQLIYVPIPIVSSEPLDLSKPKKDKFYQCQFCSIHFRSLKTLHAHQDNYCIEYRKKILNKMQMHFKFQLLNNQSCLDDNELLFKCTICSAMFNKEDILLNHIKSVHTNEKLIECLECRSRFCSKWNLIRHMKLLHTNIKDDSINLNRHFSCHFCHIKFSNMDILKEHITNYCLSRSTISTYCSSCRISFQHKTSYDAHKMYYCRET